MSFPTASDYSFITSKLLAFFVFVLESITPISTRGLVTPSSELRNLFLAKIGGPCVVPEINLRLISNNVPIP